MELFDKAKLTAYLLDPKMMHYSVDTDKKAQVLYARSKLLDMKQKVTIKLLALESLIFSMEMWIPYFGQEDVNTELAYRFINIPNAVQTMGHGYSQNLKMVKEKLEIMSKELSEIYQELGGLL